MLVAEHFRCVPSCPALHSETAGAAEGGDSEPLAPIDARVDYVSHLLREFARIWNDGLAEECFDVPNFVVDTEFNDAVNDDCPGRVRILSREHHVGECVAGLEQILVVDGHASQDQGLDVGYSDLGDEGD